MAGMDHSGGDERGSVVVDAQSENFPAQRSICISASRRCGIDGDHAGSLVGNRIRRRFQLVVSWSRIASKSIQRLFVTHRKRIFNPQS